MLDKTAYETLSRWIVSGFPTHTTQNVTDSLSMRLLQRLSSSLLFAEYPSTSDVPQDLHAFWRKVELSFEVLKVLETGAKGSRTSKTASPISRKRTNRGNPDHFDSIGISVPTTDAEVHDVRARVLSELQSILEVRAFTDHPCILCSIGHSTTSSF